MMKNKTIRKVFLGIENELYKSIQNSEKYKKLREESKIHEEMLIETFDYDQERLFDEVWSMMGDSEAMYLEAGYIRGFKDANKLRDESLRK